MDDERRRVLTKEVTGIYEKLFTPWCSFPGRLSLKTDQHYTLIKEP